MANTAIMTVWNVGHGLAVHVKAPNGKYIVIDLGSSQNVSPLLDLLFVDVGYMVITHPHLDHISDIDNINFANPAILWRCKSFSRKELMEEASEIDKEKIKKYCDFVEKYNIPVEADKNPKSGNLFGGMIVQTFATTECEKNNKNNFSAIVVFKLGNAKIVVCGDNEKESFEQLLQRQDFKDSVHDAWVLIAPHHGRNAGYCKQFVDLVNPFFTVISDSSENEFSAKKEYEEKSKGYTFYNASTGKNENKSCLETNIDGNIEIEFGETDYPEQYSGRLHVEINK
ncbi:MAG: MBL fold metallo-hydrolase [Bacteroidales bacterium]|nr:MBL fold metallo-hydrolase [Bacteroidales bacterium]